MIDITEMDTRKQPAITPRITLAFMPETCGDARQHALLQRLHIACYQRGGAIYGSLSELQAACGVTFSVCDLERLYEAGTINMLRDQDGWLFVTMEAR